MPDVNYERHGDGGARTRKGQEIQDVAGSLVLCQRAEVEPWRKKSVEKTWRRKVEDWDKGARRIAEGFPDMGGLMNNMETERGGLNVEEELRAVEALKTEVNMDMLKKGGRGKLCIGEWADRKRGFGYINGIRKRKQRPRDNEWNICQKDFGIVAADT
ncbi:hypothetical protein BDQ12DRAFT_663754 [Crucibulum laeve]|uniref:Uncharacterized protein n=1 Tax=Crucibulum laeve TaxID=68775 RepID=A0A5C3M8Y4_9AGAR|nr:hypothetical protein BDQ12DRAFT_663754 [Crucibulum laeve]